jgi:Bacterial Ig-like domain (group 3)
MRSKTFISILVLTAAVICSDRTVFAQVTGNTDANVSQMLQYQAECAIAKNPSNHLQMFALCNKTGAGLFAARSVNGGATWTFPDAADKAIADGDAGQGPLACCDPNLAWDTFGNLFITYLGDANTVETILSTDGGLTFTNLASFAGSNDQPTVVAENTTAPGVPVALWIVWNQAGSMRARGATVTGLGSANVSAFSATQNIPGTASCSFGDIVIAPSGVVVQTCEVLAGSFGSAAGQAPSTILVNIDADGRGAGNFGPTILATATNVGAFDSIPAQAGRTIDAEPGLAYDRNPASPHFGRLYMVYTDEVVDEGNDTDIMLRFSDNNGATWSNPPIRVNDDATTRSQFLPKIATNPLSGNVAVCWHDARNSATNTAMQEFCAISNRDLFPAFIGANVQISDGASTSSANPNQFSDYSGLTYFQGRAHPIWGDTSNSGGLNPNTTTEFDAYTDRVLGGAAANEGDPHITTVNGINYDFQSAGEFTVLREGDGLEIQTRQTAVSTTSTVGPNGHTGLTTCVSLNTAVAARVGKHRISYQPDGSGNDLQLRVDGVVTAIPQNGLNLGLDGKVTKAGDGIKINFPNGTVLVATPLFWSSYQVWYLNVNVHHTTAVMGVMGAITSGTWLPRLPDRSSLGPKPAALNQRYNDLYVKFADAWRVTNSTSLFDYAPGTSTATFTISSWPMQNAQCVIPQITPVRPAEAQIARDLCRNVVDKNRQANCIFDVTVTGEHGFAKLYLNTERVLAGLTTTIVSADKDHSNYRQGVVFTASILRELSRARRAPTGTVQFFVDGERAGRPITLNASGRASWKTAALKYGEHKISASYAPTQEGGFLASSSTDIIHIVTDNR